MKNKIAENYIKLVILPIELERNKLLYKSLNGYINTIEKEFLDKYETLLDSAYNGLDKMVSSISNHNY